MAKVFRAWNVDQGRLLPSLLHEFVPPGHMAHFVLDTVREALAPSAILDTYTEERGYPPYHPVMMVALLLYGYSHGLYAWPMMVVRPFSCSDTRRPSHARALRTERWRDARDHGGISPRSTQGTSRSGFGSRCAVRIGSFINSSNCNLIPMGLQ